MIRRLLFLLVLSLGVVQFQECRGLTFNEVATSILLKSPVYTAATYTLDSEAAALKTASNLPDPEIKGEYLVLPSDHDNRWTLELGWGVEWPGVYKARSVEAKEKLSASQLAVVTQRMETLAEIKSLLADYVQCVKKISILEELNQNNDSIYKLAEHAARGGEMTILDLNKVKLEYANIRTAKAAIEEERNQIVASLSQIYGDDCHALLQQFNCEFPQIVIPSQEQISGIKDNAPEVLNAMAEAEAARKSKDVVKMEALPSLALGYKHSFEDGFHFNGVTFGVSLPIFSSRGKQKAADAEIKAAEYQAEARALEIEAEAQQNCRSLQYMDSQIRELTPLIESADYNTALLKAYKGGVLTLIEYISDRNYFTTAAIELVTLRCAATKTLINLDKYLQLP